MLTKLTPGINFINKILLMHFSYKSALRSFFYLHVTREKLLKRLSYEKCVHKMLMKLTPEGFLTGLSHTSNNPVGSS